MGGRWRDNGAQRARRFKTEAEALAFDEGVSGGAGKPRSPTPNVYPYETTDGSQYEDVWLREPAEDTPEGLGRECAALAGALAQVLTDLLEEMGDFSWPVEKWGLLPRGDRAVAADAFNGRPPTVRVAI